MGYVYSGDMGNTFYSGDMGNTLVVCCHW